MKNATATGNDHINIETLKAGKETISKTLAKLFTKCLSERWNTHSVEEHQDLKNHRPIWLLSNSWQLFLFQLTRYRNTIHDETMFVYEQILTV